MSFQIKDFLSIVASEINYMRGTQDAITDFNVGSVARTLVEAPAIEIDELYQQMFYGLREAIPVSVYNSFDFTRLPAIGASGVLRFTVDPVQATDVLIPAGTEVTKPGGSYKYITSADATIPTGGSSVDVLSYCDSAGSATNAPAGSLTEMVTQIQNVTVENQSAFLNGRDIESDLDRKVRFIAYITTIARGTVAALRYGATTTRLYDVNGYEIERVVEVSVVEPYLIDPTFYPPALVWIYVHNGSSGTSAPLVAECQKVIDGYRDQNNRPVAGWKAAGVVVNVYPATDIAIDVDATLEILEGHDGAYCASEVERVLKTYIDGLGIGSEVVHAELVARAMEIPGVYNVSFHSPAADMNILVSQKAVSGTMTLVY